MAIRATVSRKTTYRGLKRRRRFARRVVSKAVKRYVRQRIMKMGETKFIQNSYSGATQIGNNAANGSLYLLPSPIQGVGYNQRVGDECLWTSVSMRLRFGFPSTSIGTSVRIMVLWLPNAFGFTTAATLEAELFDNGGLAPFSLCHTFRDTSIKILSDRLVGFNSAGGGSGVVKLHFANTKVMKKTSFTAGTTTADKGKLAVYMCSSQPTATDVAMGGTIRYYFKDV